MGDLLAWLTLTINKISYHYLRTTDFELQRGDLDEHAAVRCFAEYWHVRAVSADYFSNPFLNPVLMIIIQLEFFRRRSPRPH